MSVIYPPPLPEGITCPKWELDEANPGASRKRCRHYFDNGACRLPTEIICVEWVKKKSRPTHFEGCAPHLEYSGKIFRPPSTFSRRPVCRPRPLL